MSREEAAAKAAYEAVTGKPWENAGARAAKLCREDAAAIIAAADAHDAGNGVHRVSLDDATVERAARAMFLADNPDADWDRFIEKSFIKDQYRRKAKAVLAAAVKGEA